MSGGCSPSAPILGLSVVADVAVAHGSDVGAAGKKVWAELPKR